MEQEAPMIFHCGFAAVILLSLIFVARWRKGSSKRKPMALVIYYVLLQIPTYALVFYSLAMAATSEDRTGCFGMAGVLWAISILVLMQGIKDMALEGQPENTKN